MRLVLTLLSLLASAPLARAGSTWHVDVAGTPPGSGTPADPYTSIQTAVGAATTVDGDVLLVAPGTYVENVSYAGKALRIESSGGPLTTFLEPAGPGHVVTVDQFACRLVGFTVRGAVGGDGVHVVFPDAWVRVERCILTDNDGAGLRIEYEGELLQTTSAGNGIGLAVGDQGLVTLARNSITWGNASDLVSTTTFTSGHDVAYCLMPWPGSTNFHADPRFFDLAGGDLHLRASSPARDAGDPGFPLDPDGTTIDLGALTYDAGYAPGTARFCFGSAELCPCGNGGSGDAGCDLPQATGGIALAIRAFDPDSGGGGTAELVGAGYPPAAQPAVTLIRSPGAQTPPVVFGDGLRCIATTGLVRIGAVLAGGGASSHTISHGAGAGTFRYQLWSRSTPSTFCTPAAFNLSNGLEVTWP